MTFRELGLCAPILSALEEQGYDHPSPIQEKAIPPALEGRDVLGCAQTGTGKTCAFAAPILQRLSEAPVKGRPIRALILTPTRELAIQIGENFSAYGKHLQLNICQRVFLRLFRHTDQRVIILFPCTELKRIFQFYNLHPACSAVVPVHHLMYQPSCSICVMSYSGSDFVHFYRVSHGKKHCFHGSLQFFQFQICVLVSP